MLGFGHGSWEFRPPVCMQYVRQTAAIFLNLLTPHGRPGTRVFLQKEIAKLFKGFFPARVLICRGGYFPPSVAVSQRRLKLEVKLLAYRPRGVSNGKIGDDLER